MTERDKRKKAAMIAVAYYIQQEANMAQNNKVRNIWAEMGKELMMENRNRVQRRGRIPLGI